MHDDEKENALLKGAEVSANKTTKSSRTTRRSNNIKTILSDYPLFSISCAGHRLTNFQSYGVEYRRWQLPVINAFGLTIHKVQGLSLPSVTLALNKSIFSDGQAYVGLSRATTSERLFLTQLDFDAIKADPEAIAEYNRLRTLASRLEG